MISPFGIRIAMVAIALVTIDAVVHSQDPSSKILIEEDGVGVAMENGQLLVAIRLMNAGSAPAVGLRLTRITLPGTWLAQPAKLPVRLRDLWPDKGVTLQFSFDRGQLDTNVRHRLVIHGTHGRAGNLTRFRVRTFFRFPGPDEGRRKARRFDIPVTRITAPTRPPTVPKPRCTRFGEEPDRPVPMGRLVGRLLPNARAVQRKKIARNASGFWGEPDSGIAFIRGSAERLDLVVHRKNGIPLDPSGGSVDIPFKPFAGFHRVVFLTGNLYGLLSIDGGASYAHIDPTTLFNNIPLDGLPPDEGLCCDANMIYIPSIDRFVWQLLTHGSPINTSSPNPKRYNRLRIAFASSEQVIASGATAWSMFDITTKSLGLGEHAFLDYPDIHFTQQHLLVSVNAEGGLMVIRVPLVDLQGSPVAHISHTLPKDGRVAWGGRLVHYSPDAAYWAGHATTSRLDVFEWLDSQNSYSWNPVEINSWTDEPLFGLHSQQVSQLPATVSITPDGTNWLEANSYAVRGGTFQSDESDLLMSKKRRIVFAWNAPPVNEKGLFDEYGIIPRPHVHIQPIVRKTSALGSSTGFAEWKAEPSFDLWNPDFAFHHAHLASNVKGEVGVSVGAGGGGSDASPMAGFLGDHVYYYIHASTASLPMYGDYSAIRRHWPGEKLFSVSDYYLEPPPGINAFHQYRLFGRPADIQP